MGEEFAYSGPGEEGALPLQVAGTRCGARSCGHAACEVRGAICDTGHTCTCTRTCTCSDVACACRRVGAVLVRTRTVNGERMPCYSVSRAAPILCKLSFRSFM